MSEPMPLRGVPPLEHFAGRRVLLLQGPVGPFFRRLAADLRAVGAKVRKVNFNGGDWLYYPDACINYTGNTNDWPAFLEAFIRSWKPDAILFYGDMRPIHAAIFDLALDREIEIYAFEEGYIRGDFITLEHGRANGYSILNRQLRQQIRHELRIPSRPQQPVGYSFLHLAWQGFWYHVFAWLLMPLMPGRTYHRGLGARELGPQIRSYWRKFCHRHAGRQLQQRLTGELSKRFFLVPLQVHLDSQVRHHSRFGEGGMDAFMREVTESFARHAPDDMHLVFKHHPMDRGYVTYFETVDALLHAFPRLKGRLHYVFDMDLPSALDHATGVVVINSTVGLSAIMHGTPVKVHGGTALYDLPGLTAQATLDEFWRNSWQHRPDARMVQRFRAMLIHACQINGNFYRRLPGTRLRCGLNWHASATES